MLHNDLKYKMIKSIFTYEYHVGFLIILFSIPFALTCFDMILSFKHLGSRLRIDELFHFENINTGLCILLKLLHHKTVNLN